MFKKLASILMIFLIVYCTDKKNNTESSIGKVKKAVDSTVFKTPQVSETFLQELYQIQEEILINPASRKHKEAFIINAYRPDENALITFGSAAHVNPKTGEVITAALVKRAALLDAHRWSAYGLLWLNNDFKPDFGKISELHKGNYRELGSFIKGDSTIIAIATNVR